MLQAGGPTILTELAYQLNRVSLNARHKRSMLCFGQNGLWCFQSTAIVQAPEQSKPGSGDTCHDSCLLCGC